MTTTRIKRRWEWIETILEVASIAGGILVAIGLCLEGWTGVGPKFVIVGVVIEVFVSGWVLLASRKLQTIHERELAAMRFETAEANARAAEANLALERLKTPRTLTSEQRERITNAMRAYSGQVFAIYASPDPEAAELAKVLKAALIDAQWSAGNPASVQTGGIGLATGRGVEIEWALSASENHQNCR